MQINENISLKPYNTFGIESKARYFITATSVEDLHEISSLPLMREVNDQRLVLGGGSNILLTGNYNGVVIKNELKGIKLAKEDAEHFYVTSAAGENWHQFVLHCIKNGYAGVENLSLIPGNVGASPMQNIGAYGVEIKDVFHELQAYHVDEKMMMTFTAKDCDFGYRESIFKKKQKGKFIITSVTFKLNKQPVYNTSYGAIQQELEAMGVTELSIEKISQAVISIRSSKLPDPKLIGNAGSFFKNPTIGIEQFNELKSEYPNIVGFAMDEEHVKLAAGWLIEQCGWKGFRKGDAGCHAKQALVLVNYGHAKGEEIFLLSTDIMQSVEKKFGVILEREVNII